MTEEIRVVIRHPGAYRYATATTIKGIKQKYRALTTAHPVLLDYEAEIQSAHIRPDGTKDTFCTTHKRNGGDTRWTSLLWIEM